VGIPYLMVIRGYVRDRREALKKGFNNLSKQLVLFSLYRVSGKSGTIMLIYATVKH